MQTGNIWAENVILRFIWTFPENEYTDSGNIQDENIWTENMPSDVSRPFLRVIIQALNTFGLHTLGRECNPQIYPDFS